MHGHLVAVEVGVERGTHQRMYLDGIAFDQHWHERLDSQAVQRGSPVEQHRAVFDHVFQDVPHFRAGSFHHALGVLDVGRNAKHHQTVHHEWLEELQGHAFGQPALVHFQFRANHNYRSTAIVHPLAQQVLAEPALLPPQEVRQALQLVIMAALDGASAAAVVYQGVHGLLQHSLFIADDDFGGGEVHQSLQAVVAVDYPAVQIVQVAGGETPAIELDHGAQLGGQHRQNREDHVLDPVAAVAERLNDPQAFDGLLAPLTRGGLHLVDQLLPQSFQVYGAQDCQNGLCPHVGLEHVAVAVLQLTVPGFGDELMYPEVFQFIDVCLVLFFLLGFLLGQLVVNGVYFRLPGLEFLLRLSGLLRCWRCAVHAHVGPVRGCVSGRIANFDVLGIRFSGVALEGLNFCSGLALELADFQFVLNLLGLYGLVAHLIVDRDYDMLGEVQDSLQVAGR